MRKRIQILVAMLFLLPPGAVLAQTKKGPTAKPKVARKAPAKPKAAKKAPAKPKATKKAPIRPAPRRKARPATRRRPKGRKPVPKMVTPPDAGVPKVVAPAPAPKPALPQVKVVIKKAEIKKPAGFVDFLGRLHLILVHLPIGWLLLLLLVDIGTFGLKLKEFTRAGALILFGTFLSLVPAVITGFARVTFVATAQNAELLGLHRNLSLGVVAVILLAFLERIRSRNKLAGPPKMFYLALVVAAVALMTLCGYMGAQLSFGRHILF